MALSLADVRRIADEVIRKENPAMQVLAATTAEGGSAYTEIIVTVIGCAKEPCRLLIARDAGARQSADPERSRARGHYNGVELTVTRRMSNNWQLLGGLTIGKDEGLYDRGLNDDFNNPNSNINREEAVIGQDSTYVGKLVGTYVFPRAIELSTNLRYFTGQPVLRQIQLRGLNQGNVTILAEPRGRTRLDNVTLWDVRVSKVFRFSRGERLEAMVDVFNLLNQAAATVINQNVGATFGRPIQVLQPRVARLGVSFMF